MRPSLLFLSVALSGLPVVATLGASEGSSNSAVAPAPADQAYDAIWQVWRTPMPEGVTPKDKAFYEFQDKTMKQFVALAIGFGEQYPNDPRRFEGWVQASFTRPTFLVGFKPEFETTPSRRNVLEDEKAVLAFILAQRERLSAVLLSSDATSRQRGGATVALLTDAKMAAKLTGKEFDPSAFEALVEKAAITLGDDRAVPMIEVYTQELSRTSTQAADAFAAKLESSPKLAPALAAMKAKQKQAADEQAKIESSRQGLVDQLKFTAADGREVDLSKLKGKVVLIDFWATWCGPCKEEIPNVVANYKKYHDKGFEVIGITLENSGVTPKDSAEVADKKLAAAKAKMLAFTEKNEMPWPQYYDGKFWKNDLSQKFGVNAIPAMILIDQDGKIVSSEARGPALEAAIKRLLKL